MEKPKAAVYIKQPEFYDEYYDDRLSLHDIALGGLYYLICNARKRERTALFTVTLDSVLDLEDEKKAAALSFKTVDFATAFRKSSVTRFGVFRLDGDIRVNADTVSHHRVGYVAAIPEPDAGDPRVVHEAREFSSLLSKDEVVSS